MNIYNQEKEFVIYKITNILDMKCYIGRTCDFKRRIKEHQKEDSACVKLRNAIQKYGWDNFITEILETCIGDEITALREKYYIWLYDSFGPLGYNLTTGGENYIVSEETKTKQSVAMSGENHWSFGLSHEDHPLTGRNRTEEEILSVTGENNWQFGVSHEDHPLTGRKMSEEQVLNQSGENHWSFGLSKEEHPNFGSKQSEETKEIIAEKHRKIFLITFLDGHFEIIDNLKQFCKEYNLTYSCMVGVANGYYKHHKGFKCEQYIEGVTSLDREITPVEFSYGKCLKYIITFPDGHQEITNNLPKFCIDNNLTYSCMIQLANVKYRNQHKGFKCEHYNEISENNS